MPANEASCEDPRGRCSAREGRASAAGASGTSSARSSTSPDSRSRPRSSGSASRPTAGTARRSTRAGSLPTSTASRRPARGRAANCLPASRGQQPGSVARVRTEDKTDDSVWAVTCVFTRAGFCRRGVSAALGGAAVDHRPPTWGPGPGGLSDDHEQRRSTRSSMSAPQRLRCRPASSRSPDQRSAAPSCASASEEARGGTSGSITPILRLTRIAGGGRARASRAGGRCRVPRVPACRSPRDRWSRSSVVPDAPRKQSACPITSIE